MNLKNFIIGTIAAFIIYQVIGGLFYQFIFPDLYPGEKSMTMLMMGALFGSMMYSYIFDKFAGAASSLKTAGITGGVIGLLNGLSMNSYMFSSVSNPPNWNNFMIDSFIGLVMGACIGIAIWFFKSKFGD